MSTPRFGVWAPVYGNHGARNHPADAPDAGYRRNRDLLVRAEQAGFDSTLLAQHVIHPSNVEDDVLETWSTLAALAEATNRIELIGAIKPLLINPLVFAKIAGNIAEISGGRLAINVVSGWFLPELEALGLDAADHDDRYAYTRGWLDDGAGAVGRQAGRTSAAAAASPRWCARRPTNCRRFTSGGSPSRPARWPHSTRDVFFINGRPLPDTVDVIDDLRARPRDREPLRFGLSAFVIARETEAEAIAELRPSAGAGRRRATARDLVGHRPEDPDVQGAGRHQPRSDPMAARSPDWSAATAR